MLSEMNKQLKKGQTLNNLLTDLCKELPQSKLPKNRRSSVSAAEDINPKSKSQSQSFVEPRRGSVLSPISNISSSTKDTTSKRSSIINNTLNTIKQDDSINLSCITSNNDTTMCKDDTNMDLKELAKRKVFEKIQQRKEEKAREERKKLEKEIQEQLELSKIDESIVNDSKIENKKKDNNIRQSIKAKVKPK